MSFKHVVMVSVSTGLLAFTAGCSKPASDGMTGAGAQKQNATANPSADATATGGLGTSQSGQVTTKPATTADTTRPADFSNQVNPTTTQTPATTPQIADKYAGYQGPSSFALSDPHNVKIYNYLKEGIVSVNGQRLAQVLPPGKVVTMPKLYDDIDYSGGYDLAIVTESGRRAQGRFDPTAVDAADWKASVSDESGQLKVVQNAGGGGGGGGDAGGDSGQNDLQNFR